jgi:replicative DNA helicase
MQNELPLPQCPEIEKSILSSFLVSHDVFLKYASELTPHDFYVTVNRKIFAYMLDTGITNMVLIGEKYPDCAYDIADMVDNIAGSENLESLIALLKDRAYRRQQINALIHAQTLLFTDYDMPALLIAEKLVSDLSIAEKSQEKPESIKQIYPKIFTQLETLSKGKGLKTWIIDVDDKMGIFSPGENVIIAARPSIGKTSFALQIARSAAKHGFPVLIFSLETTKVVMGSRLVFGESETSYDLAMRGNVKEVQKMDTIITENNFIELPIYIDYSTDATIGHIRSISEYYVKKYGIQLIIVDHIGLIKQQGRSRNEELTIISNELKNIGLHHNIVMMPISQLSRSCEMRNPPSPILSDLRDSGAIEQDADKVIMLYREDYYKSDSKNKGIVEIKITKNKNGRTGTIYAQFDKETMTFKNLAPGYDPEPYNRSEF